MWTWILRSFLSCHYHAFLKVTFSLFRSSCYRAIIDMIDQWSIRFPDSHALFIVIKGLCSRLYSTRWMLGFLFWYSDLISKHIHSLWVTWLSLRGNLMRLFVFFHSGMKLFISTLHAVISKAIFPLSFSVMYQINGVLQSSVGLWCLDRELWLSFQGTFDFPWLICCRLESLQIHWRFLTLWLDLLTQLCYCCLNGTPHTHGFIHILIFEATALAYCSTTGALVFICVSRAHAQKYRVIRLIVCPCTHNCRLRFLPRFDCPTWVFYTRLRVYLTSLWDSLWAWCAQSRSSLLQNSVHVF